MLTSLTSNNITSQPVSMGQLGNPGHLATSSLIDYLPNTVNISEVFPILNPGTTGLSAYQMFREQKVS